MHQGTAAGNGYGSGLQLVPIFFERPPAHNFFPDARFLARAADRGENSIIA